MTIPDILRPNFVDGHENEERMNENRRILEAAPSSLSQDEQEHIATGRIYTSGDEWARDMERV